jgi:hypothetical protein
LERDFSEIRSLPFRIMLPRNPKRRRVMKCSNPNCSHGIGLVAYRRGLFGKGLYCSKQCRDTLVRQPQRQHQDHDATTYFEWLFSHPIEHPRPALLPVPARTRAAAVAWRY